MSSSPLAGLAERHRRPEVMDGPGLNPVEHARALRGLGRINWFSRSAAILWPAIARLASADPGRPIRVLDLASGGGDVPMALARRAAARRLKIEVEGSDTSPEAVRFAMGQAEASGSPVRFRVLDALRDPIPGGFDVLSCSLFLHHLEHPEAVRLLRTMADAAARLVLVNDLARTRAGYLLAWTGCRVLSRSPVVHHDGPVSVASAFTPDEALRLADEAGLGGATIARRWPQRFLLAWGRP
jgi:2-polyprenyl-3-methyl-5-hydroxy-6-metoxy-1,4-benzoquinol methylase